MHRKAPLYFLIDASQRISSQQLGLAAKIVGRVIARARDDAQLKASLWVSLLSAAARTEQIAPSYPLSEPRGVSLKRGVGQIDMSRALAFFDQCVAREHPDDAERAVVIVLTTPDAVASLADASRTLPAKRQKRIVCFAIGADKRCAAANFATGRVWDGREEAVAGELDLAPFYMEAWTTE